MSNDTATTAATTPPSATATTAASAAATDSRSLWKRLALGFSSQFLNLGVFVASRILLVPLFINAWGVALYADWLVLVALSLSLQVLVMGQHIKFGNEIRHAWARREIDAMNAAFRVANGFWLLLFPAVMLGTLGLFSVVDLSALMSLDMLSGQQAAWVLALLSVASMNILYQTFNRAIYQARGAFSRGELVITVCVLIETGLIALMLFLDGPVLSVALVQGVAMPLIASAVILRDSLTCFPELRFAVALRRGSLPSPRDVYDYGVPHAADIISSNAPMLILGLVNVPNLQVVQFGLARTATNMMRFLLRPIVSLVTMEASRLRIQEDHRRRAKMDNFGMLVGAVLAGGIAGALVGSGDVIYEVWTDGEVAVDFVLLGLVALHTGAWSLGLFVVNLLRYGGESSALARPATLNVLGYCILGYAAGSLFGVYGLLATVAALDALLMFVVPAYAVRRRMGIAMWRTVGLATVAGVLTFAAAFTVCDWFWALVW